jgi:UDP-glucose 4-epimerase/UDP-glucuronate decarboxylase
MKKIILTGHRGFIGSHYFDKIKDEFNITTFDRRAGQDLCSPAITESAPDCDIVVHMAATNGTRLFYEQPTEVAFNNTLPTFNLINRYKNTNTKFVFTSTCEIFNGAIDRGLHPVPTDESVPVMFEDIINPRWSYSIPKALGENLVANSGLDWLVIRYFNIYGPRQIDHFISEFVERVAAGEYYIKGNDTRSFCYIDDAIEITHRLVMNSKNAIVNVGRQEEFEIAEVARTILDIMGIDPNKLEILPGPKGSAKRRCPDTTKMKELTGFTEYTSLRDGLKKTVESLL